MKTIAVLGVDGSGKSTLICEMENIFRSEGYEVELKHLRPHVLPPLAKFRLTGNRGRRVTDACELPHSLPTSSYPVSIIRLIYLSLDYLVCYFPYFGNAKKVRIYDRYFYDLYIDSKRFRIGLPLRFIFHFIRIFKKPDLIIILTGEPHDIHNRKPELSISEIREQQYRLSVILNKTGAYGIDTTQSLGHSINEMKKILQRYV